MTDLIVETGFDENSVPKYTFLSHKKHANSSYNNGFVFETCLPNRFEPLFWRFRAWYSEIDSFRAGRTIFSYVAPKTGCPDTQNKNSVTPCHFYTKIIIILHEKSGVEQNDHFTKLSLWVNLNLGAFGAQNDHFSRLSFYREGTVLWQGKCARSETNRIFRYIAVKFWKLMNFR